MTTTKNINILPQKLVTTSNHANIEVLQSTNQTLETSLKNSLSILLQDRKQVLSEICRYLNIIEIIWITIQHIEFFMVGNFEKFAFRTRVAKVISKFAENRIQKINETINSIWLCNAGLLLEWLVIK